MLAGSIKTPGSIELVDVPEPEFTEPQGQIIFQPEMTCLCGSDLPFFIGEDGHQYPLPDGYSLHEMIGTVIASNGERFQAGDKVLAVPIRQRGFYERFCLTDQRVIPLDTSIPPAEAVLAQPFGTVLYAMRKLPNLLGATVAIVGQGPIGQMFCTAMRNAGAQRIIAIDKLEGRIALSSQMGATDSVCSANEDPLEAVKRITSGQLCNVVVEAVGHASLAVNECVDLCRHAGTILSFGVPSPGDSPLRWFDIFTKNLTLITSVNPDFSVDFPLAMQMISERRVDFRPLITHHFPLADIQTAYDVFCQKRENAQKVFVEFPANTF